MKLVIGNKNYSSWSLRPWLLAKQAGIPFEEIRVRLLLKGFPPKSAATRRLAACRCWWTAT